MDPAASPPPFVRSTHLAALVATAERLAALVAAATPTEVAREEVEKAAAIATLRLDGLHLERTLEGWDADRAYHDARAALAADDLADRMLTDPAASLPELHARLLGDDRAQRPFRESRQAVHDASIGRVIVRGVEPGRVPGRMAALSVWLTSTGAREHGLVSSGVAHYETIVTQPYETANGRLARTAARLLLRARSLDPHRLAIAEPLLDEDPIGYYEQVAATMRRRDLTIWLEHWGEAVTGGLRRAARRLGLLDADVAERAERFLRELGSARFTIGDYRAAVDVGPEEARQDLDTLLDTGRVTHVFGARGLRFTTKEEDSDGVS